MTSEQTALSIVLEENRQTNFRTLIHTPYADEFDNAAQRARWSYICKFYQKSKLVRYGNHMDFQLVFHAWNAIDALPIKTMTRKVKSAMYLSLFEGTYL